ncbi:MAG: hypothetical protein S4CHLAM37_16940 [Chlamydiia bacterium]|nr:hypothetical protein [Chlamydiia bacterium]
MGTIGALASSSFKGVYHDVIAPLKKDYDNTIEEALKVDHQIYTEERLKPFSSGSSPALPGITNLITSPLVVIKNIYNLLNGKVIGNHPVKIEAGIKVGTSALSFTNALLTTLKYAIAFKVIVGVSIAITPIILLTGLVISCFEIAIHSYKFKKGSDFLKLITKDLFKDLTPLKKAANEKYLNRPKVQRFTNNVLKQIKSSKKQMEKDYGEEFVKSFTSKLNLISNYCRDSGSRTDMEVRTLVSEALDDYNKVFCVKSLKNIHKKYMEVSDKRKDILRGKATRNFYNMHHEKALKKSLHRIQNDFTKKKIKLGERTEPWVAAEFANKYNSILAKIESTDQKTHASGIKEGTQMIVKMTQKCRTNQALHVFGIIAFASILASYALSVFVPMFTFLPVIFMATATGYSLVYYLIKKGQAESRTDKFDYYNCIPKWIQWIGSKFKASKTETETKVIKAVDLTGDIRRERKLA